MSVQICSGSKQLCNLQMQNFVKAPNDSLDIHLKSAYDHHLGLFQNKSQTVTQKETLALDNA